MRWRRGRECRGPSARMVATCLAPLRLAPAEVPGARRTRHQTAGSCRHVGCRRHAALRQVLRRLIRRRRVRKCRGPSARTAALLPVPSRRALVGASGARPARRQTASICCHVGSRRNAGRRQDLQRLIRRRRERKPCGPSACTAVLRLVPSRRAGVDASGARRARRQSDGCCCHADCRRHAARRQGW